MKSFLTALLRSTRGTTAIEYGLILAMIFLAIVGAVRGLGSQNGGIWNDFSTKSATAMNAAG